jgi:site-specific recombinase XerD
MNLARNRSALHLRLGRAPYRFRRRRSRYSNRIAKDKLPNAWLFTRKDGKAWEHSDWDELVRDAAMKAGLPQGVCPYTLRHSFITQSLMDGMATLDVARITGTSLAMIEKHYGHLVMNAAR